MTAPASPIARRRPLRRPSINITPLERAGRVAIGAAVAVVAALLLASGGSPLAVVLKILLAAAGVDLIITGTVGHCPLYAMLGHLPASLRSSR